MDDAESNIVKLSRDARATAESFGVQHNRELLTILFTDLVGSTRLQSELGNTEAARINDIHRRIVRETLTRFDAREIEWAGDSCLAVFTKPSDAVTFALRMLAEHRRIRKSEPNLPDVRTGIHMGEILVRRHHGEKHTEDLFGLQVSEAARIMSLARPNQILCSRAVFDNARAALHGSSLGGIGSIVWLEHARYQLAGISQPIEICEVGENEYAPLKPPPDSDKCRRVRSHTSTRARLFASAVILTVLGVAILGTYVASRRTRSSPTEAEAVPMAATPDEPKVVQRVLMGLRPEHPMVSPEFDNYPLAISPDGSQLVYVALVGEARMLVVRPMDKLESRVLPGTENATNPFFSPDGRHVAFIADGKLRRVDLNGGMRADVATCQFGMTGEWSDDGSILFTPGLGGGIHRVSENGGTPVPITELLQDDAVHFKPELLPDGSGLLYSAASRPTILSATVRVKPSDQREEIVVDESAAFATYAQSGHIVYAQVGRFVAQAFDIDSLTALADPVAIPEDYITERDSAPSCFDLSASGTLVYVPGGGPSQIQVAPEFAWIDRNGNEEPAGVPATGIHSHTRISPDGRYLVSSIAGPLGGPDIWVYDIQRGGLQRITNDVRIDASPGWLPDGRIIFSANENSPVYDLFVVSPTALSPPERLTRGTVSLFTPAAAAEGNSVIVTVQTPETGFDVGVVSLDSEATAQVLIQTEYHEGNAVLSPDGRCLAYATQESGTAEVFAVSYPDLKTKIKLSANGGTEPCWSPDGSELYYRSGDDMMAVGVETQPELRADTPVRLFTKKFFVDPLLTRVYDVSPVDGRFLIMRVETGNRPETISQIVVVTNWFEELRRLAPREAQ